MLKKTIQAIVISVFFFVYSASARPNHGEMLEGEQLETMHVEPSEQCVTMGKNRSRFLERATKGDVVAQYCVARSFLPAVGSKNDPNRFCRNEEEAEKWLSKAAKQGLLDALYLRAILIYSKDTEQAVALFQKAAELGHAQSMYHLGTSLENGVGVPQNEIQALMWLTIGAAKKSDMSAVSAMRRDMLAKRLSRNEVTVAQKLSTRWRPKNNQRIPVVQIKEEDCELE
jgi:hypothetical protein